MQGTVSAGHPVDIAFGAMFSSHLDFEIPGRFPIRWERFYSTSLLQSIPGAFGPGWTCSFYSTLTRIGKDYHYINPNGAVEIFPDPDDKVDHGGIIRNLGGFSELAKQGTLLKLTQWNPDTGIVSRAGFFQGVNGKPWPLRNTENMSGASLELAWDESSRLIGIRQQPEKRTIALESDSKGRISQISFRHSDGRRSVLARFQYDDRGLLVAASDAANVSERYEYNLEMRMTRELAKDGGVFSFKYDDLGRCFRTWGLDGYDLKSIRYLDHVNMSEVTDSRGKITRYQWLPTGQVTMWLDAQGGKHTTEYDEHGRIIKKTDPMEGLTEFSYDSNGNRNKIVRPGGSTLEIKFNSFHLPVEMIDPNGNLWARKYDPIGRLICATDPLGQAWLYAYDSMGNFTTISDPDGSARSFQYSEDGVLTGQTDWEGRWYKYRINDMGRPFEMESPDGGIHRILFDSLGKPIRIEFPDQTFVLYRYDAGGNLTAASTDGITFEEWFFGPCKRMRAHREPSGITTLYEWGLEPWLLLSVTNPKGETCRFEYNAIGRLIKESDFSGRTLIYSRDLAGNVIGIVNTAGERTEYSYDKEGRVLSREFSDGKVDSFEYDSAGFLKSAKNDSVAIGYERDLLGRVIKEIQGDISIERQYDAADNVCQLKSSILGSTSSSYDRNGNLAGIDLQSRGSFSFKSGIHGEISRGFSGGCTVSQQFENNGQLIRQTISTAASVPNIGTAFDPPPGVEAFRTYTYSSSGAVLSIKEPGEDKLRYGFDKSERLTTVSRGGILQEEYRYSRDGELTAKIMADKSALELVHGPGGRVLQAADTTYSYDTEGRMISKKILLPGKQPLEWFYSWGFNDRLRSIHLPNGAVWEYQYDAFGRRILKTDGKSTVRFIWDGENILHEIDETKFARSWLWEPGSFCPLITIQGDKTFLVLNDHLGTPIRMLDEKGDPVWDRAFSAWGETKIITGTAHCDIGFPGQWLDAESGIYYNRFRYFDPGIVSYLSPDPIGMLGGNGLYQYVWNPISWIDPYGLCQIGTRVKDKVSTTQLRNRNLKKGTEMLEAMGLTPRDARGGGTEFVDARGQVRVRYDLEGPNGGAHWHKFYTDEHGRMYRQNDNGYVRSWMGHPNDDENRRTPELHIRAG